MKAILLATLLSVFSINLINML